MLWQFLTDPELERARDEDFLVLIPIGAMEQHGPHLPVDTDTAIAWAVARAVAERLEKTIVAPPVWWGYSPSQMSFASTISLRPETMTRLLEDICGSIVAHGFRRLALISSHATNRPVGNVFVREFAAQHGVTMLFMHYGDFAQGTFAAGRQTELGGAMHAGEFETALQLHLHPDLVRMDRAEGEYVDAKSHFGISTATGDFTKGGNVSLGYDVRKLFPSGVMGDPRPATAELGAQLFEAAVDGVAAVLDEYRRFDYGDTARPSVVLSPDGWSAASE